MINNDVMRSLRYILNLTDSQLREVILSRGLDVPLNEIKHYLKEEEDPSFRLCDDNVMAHFLDGLIYLKRGKDESRPPQAFELPISNNLVLKKLKVAFKLDEVGMHDIFGLADYKIGRAELSAFLRKRGQPNYRECGDQVLRYFLKGLKNKIRGK